MSFYGELVNINESSKQFSFEKIQLIINKVVNKYKNEIFNYGLKYNPDLKKSDLKVSDNSINYDKNRIEFIIDLGNDFDGWLDCYIDLTKKESDLSYFDYNFSD